MSLMKNPQRIQWESVQEVVMSYDRAQISYRGVGKISWETVTYRRAKVPGGWLVQAREGLFVSVGLSPGVTFISDPNYSWVV